MERLRGKTEPGGGVAGSGETRQGKTFQREEPSADSTVSVFQMECVIGYNTPGIVEHLFIVPSVNLIMVHDLNNKIRL